MTGSQPVAARSFPAFAQRQRDVRRPQALGIFANLDADPGDGHQLPQRVFHRRRATAGDVVHFTRFTAAFEQQHVRRDDVADVEKIALGVEVADEQQRIAAGRDPRQLQSEGGHGETPVLTGPDMVERARDDDVHAVRRRRREPVGFSGDFARRVRIRRVQRRGLDDRKRGQRLRCRTRRRSPTTSTRGLVPRSPRKPRIASSRRRVPPALMSWVVHGSAIDAGTKACAARWATASGWARSTTAADVERILEIQREHAVAALARVSGGNGGVTAFFSAAQR